ncbi:hypothetical protein HPB50_027154 [Hyalomma asiaticum]|uniref:Uncharacterized protein n=1 Tax=Hyalomma asiaticum TaxID=266040 RepID=A0ACB7TMX9_HYAAI|nr:hypothetical protein HPB50_027154 [Hyalomma asiaticum]
MEAFSVQVYQSIFHGIDGVDSTFSASSRFDKTSLSLSRWHLSNMRCVPCYIATHGGLFAYAFPEANPRRVLKMAEPDQHFLLQRRIVEATWTEHGVRHEALLTSSELKCQQSQSCELAVVAIKTVVPWEVCVVDFYFYTCASPQKLVFCFCEFEGTIGSWNGSLREQPIPGQSGMHYHSAFLHLLCFKLHSTGGTARRTTVLAEDTEVHQRQAGRRHPRCTNFKQLHLEDTREAHAICRIKQYSGDAVGCRPAAERSTADPTLSVAASPDAAGSDCRSNPNLSCAFAAGKPGSLSTRQSGPPLCPQRFLTIRLD